MPDTITEVPGAFWRADHDGGRVMLGAARPSDAEPLYRLPADALERLAELMARCAQGLDDDCSTTFGGDRWNRSANSFEAAAPLQEVAGILGIPGPEDLEAE